MPKYDIKASYKEWSSGTRHIDTRRHQGKNAYYAVGAMKESLSAEYAPEGIDNFSVISIRQVRKTRKKPVKAKRKKSSRSS